MQNSTIFVIAATILVISGMSFAGALSLPPNAIEYVPVNITNTQPLSTGSNFQQMIVLNTSYYPYSANLVSTLMNVEFTYSNGTIVPSWLESTGSNTVSNAIYWLKLSSGIAANSNVTVYMVIMPITRNLFNKNKEICEAPTLSPSYTKYDCGKKIFNFYDNFAGIYLGGSWHHPSGIYYSVNNGIQFYATAYPYWGGLYNTYNVPINSVMEAYLNNNVGYRSCIGPWSVTYAGSTHKNRNDDGGFCDNAKTGYFSISFPSNSVNVGTAYQNTFYLISGYDIPSNVYMQSNYTTVATSSATGVSGRFALTFFNGDGGFYQWVRSRTAPPNDVMPIVTFGTPFP
ncbi:MAG: hypothetical protein ACHQX1_00695 [Candidatus Micrarchaeales archaeon]